MSVDLTIPGDPAGIRRLAEWLAPRVDDANSGVFVDAVDAASSSQYYWTGESGDAYRSASGTIRDRSTPIPPYLRRAADVFLAYANRLQRGQEDFDELLSQAMAADLTVVRRTRIVLAPVTYLTYCPTDDSPEAEVAEWNRYVRRVTVYNALSANVGTWWGELEAWLVEHMAALVTEVEDFVALSATFENLTSGNELVVDTAFETAEFRANRDFAEWSEVLTSRQADAELFTRGLRSGNPALRAASEAANPRAIRQGLQELGEVISGLRRATRIIPGVGIVVDVAFGLADVAGGDSPGSVGAEILGSIAGGAAVGGTIAAFGGPPGWVIGGAVVASVIVGAGARWGYEAWVPLNVRESIDDFFVGSPPVLVNEATGTWAVGTR